MKISVCGKGGSGKSVVTALLAHGVRERGLRALVVDSDESNSGLHRLLGFEAPPAPLLDLVGGKQEVKNVFPKTPPAQSENETNVLGRARVRVEDLPPQHMFTNDGLSLVAVGKILQSLEGCACPMGVLSREFLKKLDLEPDQVAIVDMEAGVEHFGRGVETSVDAVLIVVDPSYESLQLAAKIKELTAGIGVSGTWAVLNKVDSAVLESKLRQELARRNVDTIGCIRYDPEVFEACLDGRPLPSNGARAAVDEILDTLLGRPR